jgi:UDP-N-acetyl-D-mannosaminuronate dehydrogenase
MPNVSLARLGALLGGNLRGKRVLLAGVSYRPGVGDTRYAPSETFARAAHEAGVKLVCHDPLVAYWPELELQVKSSLPEARELDALVLAVAHREYQSLDFVTWLGGHTLTVLDSDNVLRPEQRAALRACGCRVESIGRGEGL